MSAQKTYEEEMDRFFPHEVLKFSIIITLMVALLTFLASMVPIQVGDPADPLRTPAGIEPEWYFLAVYQLLKYVPRWLGVLFSFMFFPFVLITLPFWWSLVNRRPWGLRALHWLVVLTVVISLTLTVMARLGFE